jgi:hypothetical protein
LSAQPAEQIAVYVPLAAGLLAMTIGVFLVINGQMISCIVAIEGNTRGTYELIKNQNATRG